MKKRRAYLYGKKKKDMNCDELSTIWALLLIHININMRSNAVTLKLSVPILYKSHIYLNLMLTA